MKEQKIILADDPQAAQEVTMTLYKSISGSLHVDKERAIYASITHKKCECGKIIEKHWTRCDNCRKEARHEEYLKKPFEEYEGQVVCDWDGDRYFFSEEDIIDFLEDAELDSIDLMICDAQQYQELDSSFWEDILLPDEEDPKELTDIIEEFNKKLRALPSPSWYPGKIRTSYILEKEESCN